jgi:putative radical SAM enzyme (TIGR03279 family)
MSGLLVTEVLPGGIGAEVGIEPGDRILSINGHPLRDIIDYNYYADEEELSLELLHRGEPASCEVERDEDESLGLIFESPEPARCGNQCIFCFVHQLPKGLRPPLYVKDEDYRLSFLYGNYVTLANITETDLERIVSQRLSPLYVSVHATEESLRRRLLGNDDILPILPLLQRLSSAGITFHTQVVLCPGINDGSHLQRTVQDLADLAPDVRSIAVVPVGLTGHRQSLPPLVPVDAAYAKEFLRLWQPRAEELASQCGEPILFFADEFYLQAGFSFPPLERYGDLPQLENGVGLVPQFLAEAEEVLQQAERLPVRLEATLVTGEAAVNVIAGFAERLAAATGVALTVAGVENRLFGSSVTVTGLVTGRDIISALEGQGRGVVLVPDVMLKEGEGVFLDDLSPRDLAELLGTRVMVVPSSPWGVYEALISLAQAS